MNKIEQKQIDVAFLSSKLKSGFNVWAQREIDHTSQSTNIHRLSDSVFTFTEYNFLPTCEQDILDGHYTFFVNKDTFEYLVYKSSDYGSLTYVIPVDFNGFLTAELLPEPSKEHVESIIAHKLLTSYFYEYEAVNQKGKNLFEEVEKTEDYHHIYSKRSLICDHRGYIWSEMKPETYSEVELQALNKLCGFIQPDIKDFDNDFVKTFVKGFKKIKDKDIKFNVLQVNNKDYTVFYRHDFGTYYSYSIIEGTMDKPVRKIAEDSDGQKKISDFVKVIPTILRNIAN
ncbi:MAG TPA: hypothetical protein DFH96_05555 [Bacteroidetes bacterium]|nr:hypothetical protein [Bacteroidota bacterium]